MAQSFLKAALLAISAGGLLLAGVLATVGAHTATPSITTEIR